MKTALASAALLAATSAIAARAGVAVTAEFLPPLSSYGLSASIGFDTGSGSNTKAGQSFLALVSGAFDSLKIGNLYHNLGANVLQQDLQIRIYDVTNTGGAPTDPALGGWDVPAADITGNTYPYSPTFQYTGPTINIIAGRQYAFLLGTAVGANVNFNSPYSINGVPSDAYADGAYVTQYNAGSPAGVITSYDLPFQVTVVVPAPASAAAFGVLSIAGATRRRR